MTSIYHPIFTGAGAMPRKFVWVLPLCMAAFVCAPAGAAGLNCSALSRPIYQTINPGLQTNLLTPWQNEVDNAVKYGFTQNKGTLFRASLTPADGLVAAHRLYKPGTNDFVWMTNPAEIDSATQKYGYIDEGVNFYVASSPGSCTQPVYRFFKGSAHRFAVSQADRDALAASGWTAEGVKFYAAADLNVNGNAIFSIAIMPDTQYEAQPAALNASCAPINGVRNTSDDRFSNRAQWLVDNKETLNLRYVLHSGDVVNWGERDEPQYNVIRAGMQKLEIAGIPYVLSQGNHDTRAVGGGGGGGPCTPATVTQDVRQSPLFNKYFSGRFGDAAGSYSPYCDPNDSSPVNPACNISNGYTTFEAGGLKWLVLSLELWPRPEVVTWAQGIVASHPSHNVIVVTHSYLRDSSGNLLPNDGYGATSPAYLRDNLITKYRNIRFVFSGHTGNAASYQYTGNPTVAYLQSLHDVVSNPVRILQIDTANNTASSYIYAPKTKQYWNGGGWSNTAALDVKTGMNYVR